MYTKREKYKKLKSIRGQIVSFGPGASRRRRFCSSTSSQNLLYAKSGISTHEAHHEINEAYKGNYRKYEGNDESGSLIVFRIAHQISFALAEVLFGGLSNPTKNKSLWKINAFGETFVRFQSLNSFTVNMHLFNEHSIQYTGNCRC